MNRPDGDFQLSSTARTSPPFKKISSFLKDNTLTVLQADKESCFTVMTKGCFSKKAGFAIQKNFKKIDFNRRKQKKTALALIQSLQLDGLRQAVNKKDTLKVFFTYETHKAYFPLRVIVSERGSWQFLFGRFLQGNLS